MDFEILKTFPLSKDGIKSELFNKGTIRSDIPAELVEGLQNEGYIRADGKVAPIVAAENFAPENKRAADIPADEGLDQGDGSNTQDDLDGADDSAVEVEAEMRAELAKLTNAQLKETAAAESIKVEANDNKAALVDKIVAGRAAVSGE